MKTKINGERRPLPAGWQWKRLSGVLTDIDNGSRPRGGVAGITSGILSIGAEHISEYGVLYLANPRYISKEFFSRMSKGVVKPGDILLVKDGATTGRVALIEKVDKPGFAINEHVFILRPDKATANSLFLLYALFSPFGQRSILNSFHGAAQGGITQNFAKSVWIPLPPTSHEQELIAARIKEQMAEARRLRLAAKRQVEALQFLISALHQEIFTSVEAKNWPIQPLSELIISGPSNGIFKSPEFFGKGARLVNVSDLYLGLEVNQTLLGRIEANAGEQVRYSVSEGDVFFCRSSLKFEGVGKCCYIGKIQEPTLFECHVIRVKPDIERIKPEYLAFYCQAGEARKYILRAAKLGTMTTINHDDIRDLPVPVPSHEVQKTMMETVIQKIERIINLEAKAEQQLEAINVLPHAILQETFGGFTPLVED